MKTLWLAAASLALLSQAQAAPFLRGGEVGNGGDSTICSLSPSNPYDGYYALDYLLTLETAGSALAPVSSWEASKARLLTQLGRTYPDLAALFDEFTARLPLDDHGDPDRRFVRPRIWEEAPYGLVDIKDQVILRRLPPNCYRKGDDGGANVIQAVIRQKKGFSTIYSYDPAVYRELRDKAPLQFSFLVVHEWLWDLTDDVQTVRRVNRLLHSATLEKLSPADFRRSLENLGLSVKQRFIPVCERTPEVRDMLEQALQKTCDRIGIDDLQKGQPEPFLTGKDLPSFALGDFSGLTSSRRAALTNNRLKALLETTFAGMYGLSELDLAGNELVTLPENIFAGTPNLTGIKLTGNRLRALPAGLFRGLHASRIDLSNNELERLPPGVFDNTFGDVILSGNRFSPQECERIRAEYAKRPQLRIAF